MASEKATQRLYAFGMFLAVSVLSGLLIAGLAFPFASMLGTTARIASDSLNDLPADFEVPVQSERSRVLMADGSELATFYNENRINVPLSKIAKIMQQAQVAVEDQAFYEHGAINISGILRQLVRNTSSGTITGGGSTLTQQYVKLVLMEKALQSNDAVAFKDAQAQSLERKIREMRYAIALEKRMSKDQILEGYLNIAYYGAGAYGVEAAAHRYFNTTAEKLTIAQSAMLAGLVKNPSESDPIKNTAVALNRRSFVLGQMMREGYITEEQRAAADAEPWDPAKVQPIREGCVSARYPHICTYVENTLLSSQMASLGDTYEARANMIKRGGLTIQTVIDPTTQDAAEKAIYDLVKPNDPVISTAVMIQPNTGLLVAMAQSRPRKGTGAGETYYNYAVRKSMGGAEGYNGGSTFKVFTLAAAFEKGFPASKSYSSPRTMDFSGTTFRTCEGTVRDPNWKSVVGGTDSVIDMYQATANSVNTYYVQLLRDVGICESVKMAERMGLQKSDGASLLSEQNPTFVLGQVDITPLSLTEAYATLANRGVRCTPRVLASIKTRDGKDIAVPPADCQKVMEPEVADATTKLLTGVIRNGTGRAAALPGGYDQAGKTGTSPTAKAVWFAGFTPELAGTAMIAVDKGKESAEFWKNRTQSLSKLRLPSGTYIDGFGGSDASKIWKAAMIAGLEGKPATKFTDPPTRVLVGERVAVPSVSGLSLEAAKKRLEEAGFSTAVWQQYSDQPAGTFLGISPSGTAPKFSTIMLRVSRGPEPVTDPAAQPQPPG